MRFIPMLLLLLTACTSAPSPEAGIVYRTTEGGPALSTTLYVYSANKAEYITAIASTNPSGIEGGFKWQLSPNGNNIQLALSGRNDRMKLPPRGVVQLWVNGNEAFYGIVPDPPPQSESDTREVQVLGGEEALRVTLMDGKDYRDEGVYDIVRDVLQRLIPPALLYAPEMIGNGSGTDSGPTLSTYFSPTSDLKTVLDGLAKSAATSWGVDAAGRVFFGRPSPAALSVAYAGQGWKALPIQGREAVTQATVRIVSSASMPEGGQARWTFGLPRTVTEVAESAQHSLYRAQAAFSAPEGVALIRPAVPLASGLSHFDSGPVRDDDPDTAVTLALTPSNRTLVVAAPVGRPVGVEFDYVWPMGEDTRTYRWDLKIGVVSALADGPLVPTGVSRTVRAILPPGTDTTGDTWEGQLAIRADTPDTATPAVPLTVSRVRFLMVDEDVAQRVAQSFLQPPFAAPAELVLHSLVPPTPDIEVTGSPAGDVSGPTSLWEYEHSDDDTTTTRIRIGATGADPTVRALKFAVRGP